jgi:hypothetical protein
MRSLWYLYSKGREPLLSGYLWRDQAMFDVFQKEEKNVFLWLSKTEWKELAMIEAIGLAWFFFVMVPVGWLEMYVLLRWF